MSPEPQVQPKLGMPLLGESFGPRADLRLAGFLELQTPTEVVPQPRC